MAGETGAYTQPTQERYRHGFVELMPQAIADEEGRPSQPYRSIDILSSLFNHNAITVEQLDAGEDFRADFRRARLDPLKAKNLMRPPISGPVLSLSDSDQYTGEGARYKVWNAVTACGGISSLAGSCVWEVLGWQIGLKRWAILQGLDFKEARGILRASLETLARHYGKF